MLTQIPFVLKTADLSSCLFAYLSV